MSPITHIPPGASGLLPRPCEFCAATIPADEIRAQIEEREQFGACRGGFLCAECAARTTNTEPGFGP